MTDLADHLRDPGAFRGAADDLFRRMLVTPEELATITLAVSGQTPVRCRQIVIAALTQGLPSGLREPYVRRMKRSCQRPNRNARSRVIFPLRISLAAEYLRHHHSRRKSSRRWRGRGGYRNEEPPLC
jgi:hypothetical protein